MDKKRLVIFSGAGMSAESGLTTYRDSGGLWEKYRFEEVATPEAFARDPELVLRFYSQRVQDLQKAQPNRAHKDLVKFEDAFHTTVVTQNVDDLHEKAGSSEVIHLHGELMKCRSTGNENYIAPMPKEGLKVGDTCPDGHQLRPHIVWFGEMVPAMDVATEMISQANILIVIGTSLNVYPAAGLVYATNSHCEIYLIDPGDFGHTDIGHLTHIKKKASEGVETLLRKLSK
jgi:NAD-dependent deacetylase